MELMLLLPWLNHILCLCGEAFFAAAEPSIVSANVLELDRLQQEGDAGAQRVLWFKENSDRLFGTTLLGTNISTVTGFYCRITHAYSMGTSTRRMVGNVDDDPTGPRSGRKLFQKQLGKLGQTKSHDVWLRPSISSASWQLHFYSSFKTYTRLLYGILKIERLSARDCH